MIDRVEVYVSAGDGGDGVVSFRREKYVPFGGPDGGNGGDGGSVFVMGDSRISTLHRFQQRKQFQAERGRKGSGKKKHGRNGQDLLIRVPLGTLVFKKSDKEKVLLADLVDEGQRVLVARGGCGGFGNARFASPTNQAPRIAQKGDVGEEAHLILDLKLIADVGIIGQPNVGKSTLLATASAARPKIADYPFTTKEPVLGVVQIRNRSFVLAEIPGLLEGAHRGLGLGHDFLRHAERTRLLIHLLDGTSPRPLIELETVNKELALFSPVLAQKPQIVAVNKIDLPEVKSRIPEIKKELAQVKVPLFFISAATTEGVAQLMAKAGELLGGIAVERPSEAVAVFQPQPKREKVIVSKEGDTFVVSSPRAERLVARMDISSPEARSYLKRQFTRMRVTSALERAGVKPGDMVRFGQVEMEWE